MKTIPGVNGAIRRKIVGAMLTAAVVGLVWAPSSSYGTQFDNSNFETGDLSGWAFLDTLNIGFAQVVDSSSFGVPALQGHYSALLVTRDTDPCGYRQDAWSVGCPSPIELSSAAPASTSDLANLNVLNAVNYSAALSQQVELRGGDGVSFDLQRFTNDGFDVDPVFVTLYAGGAFSNAVCGTIPADQCRSAFGPVIAPPSPSSPGAAVGTPAGFNFWEGPRAWEVVAPSDGLWTLTIGVGSYADSLGSSGLLIDDFHILPQQAPEPGTLFLLGAVLIGVPAMRRRRNPSRAA